MNDITLLIVGMFIGLYAAGCIAGIAIFIDHVTGQNDKLVKKFAWATGISEDAAREILMK